MKIRIITIFNVYFFLLIFNTLNRSFSPYLDIRFLLITFSTSLIIYYIFNSAKKKISNLLIVILIWFFAVFIGNINWMNTSLKFHPDTFSSYFVLMFFLFLNLITVSLYKNYIEKEKFLKYFYISLIFMIFSILLEHLGFNLYIISDYVQRLGMKNPAEMSENEWERHSTILGLPRFAGYAWDPSYASIYLIFGVLISFYFNLNYKKLLLFTTTLLLVLLSSKTAMIAILMLLAIRFVFLKKYYIGIFYTLLTLFFIYIFLFGFNFGFGDLSTMVMRLGMWNSAFQWFLENPLVGNGFTAARSAHEYFHGWYVTPHSTYFAILADSGLFGIIMFLFFFYSIYRYSAYNKLLRVMIFVFLIFALTYEYQYQNLIASIFLPLSYILYKGKKKFYETRK